MRVVYEKKIGSSQYFCMDETNNFLYFSKNSDTSVKLKNNLKIKMYTQKFKILIQSSLLVSN